jgi:hypothetical protein
MADLAIVGLRQCPNLPLAKSECPDAPIRMPRCADPNAPMRRSAIAQ